LDPESPSFVPVTLKVGVACHGGRHYQNIVVVVAADTGEEMTKSYMGDCNDSILKASYIVVAADSVALWMTCASPRLTMRCWCVQRLPLRPIQMDSCGHSKMECHGFDDAVT
jgi:hypothetical protein